MPGAKELKRTLSAALREGILSHAVLIEGEKGTGKKELSLWLAKAILCRSENRPCENCSVCRKIESGNHPDVEIYGGSGGARSFHIESIREIKNSLWLAPNESEQKVYILLNIEDMTQSIMQEMFCMIMVGDVDGLNVPFGEFSDAMSDMGDKINMSIHVMHEDLFNSMHKI